MSIYHAPTPRSKLNVSDDVFAVCRDRCVECVGEYKDDICPDTALCVWFCRHVTKLQAEINTEVAM